MPAGRHRKLGPVEHPQVTLRGQTLAAMQALADAMGDDLSVAIRGGLVDWLTTESASDFFRTHRLDLAAITGEKPRRRRGDVLRLEPRTGKEGD
jgi:hypothetical protein